MTKKEKDRWLDAIGKLRKHYEQYELDQIPPSYEDKFYLDCPLCEVVKSIYNFKWLCTPCLWVKFEGSNCISKPYENDLTFQRLDRLDRWEKLLEGE